jgi:hypothetical protein
LCIVFAFLVEIPEFLAHSWLPKLILLWLNFLWLHYGKFFNLHYYVAAETNSSLWCRVKIRKIKFRIPS